MWQFLPPGTRCDTSSYVKADVDRTRTQAYSRKAYTSHRMFYPSVTFVFWYVTIPLFHMSYVNMLSVTVTFHCCRERAVHQLTFVFSLFCKSMLIHAYDSFCLSEYSESFDALGPPQNRSLVRLSEQLYASLHNEWNTAVWKSMFIRRQQPDQAICTGSSEKE
jgi:hypothetical protein